MSARTNSALFVNDSEQEILTGLRLPQKTISPKFFYDEAGSKLFDEICRQPEYYPTRTELDIMHRHIDDIVDLIKKDFLVVQMDMWGDREFRNFDGKTMPESKLAQKHLVRGTPTTLFFDDTGTLVFRMPGYAEPPVFKAVFRYVNDGIYKKVAFFDWLKTQKL